MLKKIIESYSFEVFIYLFRFLSNIFLIRLLGPELNGKFAYILAVIGLFNFVNIFSSDIIIYSEAVKEKTNSELIYNNNLIKLFMGFILIISIFTYLYFIKNEFSNLIFFILIFTELVRQIINNYFQFHLQALNQVIKYKFLDLFGYVYLCISFLILYYFRVSDFYIIAILLFSKEFLVSGICFFQNKNIPLRFKLDFKNLIYSFNFGKYLVLPKLTNIFVTNITVIILGSSGYFIEAGIISLLARIKMIISFPVNSIEPLIRRVYFKLSQSDSYTKLNDFHKSYLNIISFYTCFIIIFVIINSDLIIIFIFGSDYLFVKNFFIVYLFAVHLNFFIRTSTYIFHSKKDTKKLGRLTFYFEITLLLSIIILVPEEILGFKLFGFGILGDLYSKLTITFLLFIYMFKYCIKKNYFNINYNYLLIYFTSILFCLIYILFDKSLNLYVFNLLFLFFAILLISSYYKFSIISLKKDLNTVLKNDL